MNTNIWVLIPAARQHLALLQECLEVLGNLVDHTLVVSNGLHPLTKHEINARVIQDPYKDINISRWWNLGLDQIEDWETNWENYDSINPHHVLVLNADARINPQGVAKLSYALDQHPEAVMAGPKPDFGTSKETRPQPLGADVRVPGYCFMLTSSHPIRLDEQFRWWCGDDDLEWRARQEGGTLRVGRIDFAHLGDGIPRGHLRDLANQDLLRFEAKWGIRPG